ncbi:MAG: SPOR domain-containing protein [Myxococcota bacterium]
MDTAMRDLEQIEERDPTEAEGTFRRAGAFVLAALLTLALVYGMAAVLEEPQALADDAQDPLAALDRAQALAVEAEQAAEVEPERLEVDRESLTFPQALLGDDRPEVAATLAAAVAEHEALAAVPVVAPVPAPTPIAVTMPAAVAAIGETEALLNTTARDPIVAAAIPRPEPRERGTVGEDGPFTLQVVSYRTEEEAETFAEALRAKGHDSFVAEADIEGRGHFYRVRIGPFETMGAAQNYRRRFERDEDMDTYVVRRRD